MPMRVALVHDWLVTHRGGEKVLEAICELFPAADVFTLIHKPGGVSRAIEAHPIHTSFLQRIPGIYTRYRYFLPLFPAAVERFDLTGFDLIISSSHCAAKGARKPPGAQHLSYVHAPMRYMWDRFDDYFGPGRVGWATRAAAVATRPMLQAWDRNSSQRVDRFVTNSRYIAEKVKNLYGRSAAVIPPPVELERFTTLPLVGGGKGDYFLSVGALAPYKRLDIAIEAFRQLGLPLWIAGSGQESGRLGASLPRNVRLLGQVSDQDLPGLYYNARALVFTAEEDFGIAPLEAQAAGRPVIALARGGALETVTAKTGVFYSQPDADHLKAAIRELDRWEEDFNPADARDNASRFTKDSFQRLFSAEVRLLMDGVVTAVQ
jgi:glycosyltransferase involved in cell wall biosynthesis